MLIVRRYGVVKFYRLFVEIKFKFVFSEEIKPEGRDLVGGWREIDIQYLVCRASGICVTTVPKAVFAHFVTAHRQRYCVAFGRKNISAVSVATGDGSI